MLSALSILPCELKEVMDIRTLSVPTKHYPPVAVAGHSNLTFELWLEFEWWQPQPEDDPHNNFFNMRIRLSNGKTYALNVWTFTYLVRTHHHDQQLGERLAGQYLVPPDLLVEKLDRPLLEAVVHDLIQTNSLRDEWLSHNSEDEPASDDS